MCSGFVYVSENQADEWIAELRREEAAVRRSLMRMGRTSTGPAQWRKRAKKGLPQGPVFSAMYIVLDVGRFKRMVMALLQSPMSPPSMSAATGPLPRMRSDRMAT